MGRGGKAHKESRKSLSQRRYQKSRAVQAEGQENVRKTEILLSKDIERSIKMRLCYTILIINRSFGL